MASILSLMYEVGTLLEELTPLEPSLLELEMMDSLLAGMLLGSSGAELRLLEENMDEALEEGEIDEAEELGSGPPQEDKRSKASEKKPRRPPGRIFFCLSLSCSSSHSRVDRNIAPLS